MKIKTKLIISFCIIIFVPSILAIATNISAYCNFQSVFEMQRGLRPLKDVERRLDGGADKEPTVRPWCWNTARPKTRPRSSR